MELAALALGFIGSLHCVLMCSPLAIAVTQGTNQWKRRLLYNTGRIATYGLLGAMTASLGFIFSIIKMQNLLSIIMGSILLIAGIAGITSLKLPIVSPILAKSVLRLKNMFHKFLARRDGVSTVLMGAINGILPCGLSFAALTVCISLRGPLDGFLFMTLFGIGTLPVMLGLVSSVGEWWQRMKLNYSTILSFTLTFSGLMLILRVFLPHYNRLHSVNGIVDIVMCR